MVGWREEGTGGFLSGAEDESTIEVIPWFPWWWTGGGGGASMGLEGDLDEPGWC